MTNEEFIKDLEYQERIMRELHGVKVAMPFKVALDAARAATGIAPKPKTKQCVCCGDWSRATGATSIPDDGRDGWHVGA